MNTKNNSITVVLKQAIAAFPKQSKKKIGPLEHDGYFYFISTLQFFSRFLFFRTRNICELSFSFPDNKFDGEKKS